MTGEPSIVFKQKALMDKNFIVESLNICKAIVVTDTSQLFPNLMSSRRVRESGGGWGGLVGDSHVLR